ncbi:hypothetical protein [Mucilaginibacter polytrichastri]|uniref:Uncharacterized protein n=1 Tax=Mucilaginibacter polytrichastri TaxID=1302689 RepID=A0A1Q5ZZE6_9SPHI|nr:hypothetical protein [Mucilaginibacter polytrichastri]OKS87119.1 hypothetical protein RG47T_2578 [Mucilaginibacter polytrichastri]SFS87741.1 hypothetical protein SAMN04487890_105188 [Mucilaginibacter polytrichastri]
MTAKYLLQLLFKALAFSFALSLILGSIYYIVTFKTGNYVQAMPSIVSGSLLLNTILTMMAFATMLLMHKSIYVNLFLRLLVFFGGTVAFMAYVFIHQMSESNKVFYASCGISFFVVQVILYYRMVKAYPTMKMG